MADSGVAQAICIGIKLPGGAEAAGSGTTLGRVTSGDRLMRVSISHEFLRLHGSVG